MIIKNREQIIDELVEMLIQFDLDCNQYDTDVYLYLDDEGNAELDTFVNPGGNGWLDDDHYTIYTDKQRYEDVISNYDMYGCAFLKDKLDKHYYCYMIEINQINESFEEFEMVSVYDLFRYEMDDFNKKIIFHLILKEKFDIEI